ncbi:hypothetical protein HK105_203314 [Polyrhizophydium stewartii]|uniref:NADP-dependent oxidoreductase domain-containing protein n=1 Tax=Polyrhizophydium stewartii TaxID=2732419 RepID=A0ABR4NCM2_9FUNG
MPSRNFVFKAAVGAALGLTIGYGFRRLQVHRAAVAEEQARQLGQSADTAADILKRRVVGTFRVRGDQAREVVRTAVRMGYRHIDSAAVYRNEAAIGEALAELFAEGFVSRSDMFITTKLGPKSQGYDRAREAIGASLASLGESPGFVDLLLIHWPGSQGMQPGDPRNAQNRLGTWRAVCEAYRDGRARSIGVSNYTHAQLSELAAAVRSDATGTLVMPMVNQFELHPLMWTPDTRALIGLCRELGICVQGYSCLGEGHLVNGDVDVREARGVAERTGATVAQVLIRWALERGDVVMPKSTHAARMAENLAATDVVLSEADLALLDGMAERLGPRRFCWDPTQIV